MAEAVSYSYIRVHRAPTKTAYQVYQFSFHVLFDMFFLSLPLDMTNTNKNLRSFLSLDMTNTNKDLRVLYLTTISCAIVKYFVYVIDDKATPLPFQVPFDMFFLYYHI